MVKHGERSCLQQRDMAAEAGRGTCWEIRTSAMAWYSCLRGTQWGGYLKRAVSRISTMSCSAWKPPTGLKCPSPAPQDVCIRSGALLFAQSQVHKLSPKMWVALVSIGWVVTRHLASLDISGYDSHVPYVLTGHA